MTRNTACQHRREAIKCKNISSLLNTTLMGYNMPFFTPFWQPNNGKKVVEFSGSRCLFLTREWHPLPSFFWKWKRGGCGGIGLNFWSKSEYYGWIWTNFLVGLKKTEQCERDDSIYTHGVYQPTTWYNQYKCAPIKTTPIYQQRRNVVGLMKTSCHVDPMLKL